MPKVRRCLLLCCLLLAVGCAGDGSSLKPLTLGAVLPTSGPSASVGQEMADAVTLAVEQWRERFAAQGYALGVNLQDDASDPKQAMSAAYAVTGDRSVFAVVAHYNSGCFLPATNVYAQAGTMAISPATTNVEITRKGVIQVARVTPHDGVQGELSAEFAKRYLKLGRIAVIHDKTQYGQGLAEVFQEHGRAIGLDVISFDGIQVGDKDFKALLTKIREAKPDAVYFGGLYDEAGFLVKQMRELQMQAAFLADDGAFGQDFFDVGGSATEGAVVSFPGTPLEKLASARALMTAFQTRFGRAVQNYAPYSYDTANILLSSAYAAILAGEGGDLRAAVVKRARAIKHEGALGTTQFDEHGDTLNQQYSFYRVKDQQWRYLATATRGAGIQVAGEATE